MRVPWTKPAVWHLSQGPAFKTTRQLGGRALVSDAFGRPFAGGNPDNSNKPGLAKWHHRDGYNVLYGDLSAAWYGDPQQRIAWWTGVDGTQGSLVYCATNAGSNYPQDPNVTGYVSQEADSKSLDVWHSLDEAHDVDAGAERGR